MSGLSVSRLVKVTVQLSPLAAAGRSFGILMVAGDSNVISGLERFRTYFSIDAVAADFGVTSPEYGAAALYFGQTPKPSTIMIGRWLRTASAAENIGGIIPPSGQILGNWTAITDGGMIIVIDGTTKTLTGLDFSAQTNLNGVATIITTALSGAGVCTWNGTNFQIASATTGAGVQASATITLTGNPANSDTVTIQGTVVTFVTGTPTGNQVKIGPSANDTITNLQTFLAASVDANLSLMTYSTVGLVTTITAKVIGTAGNAYTLVKSGTNITVSGGGTLGGGVQPSSVGYATTGSGTSVSIMLGLTAALSQALVPGYAAETPVQCAAALASKSTAWYGLMFQASVQPTDQQNLDVSSFIEALEVSRVFGVTITNTNVLSNITTNDLASLMAAGGYEQSCCQYSQNPYAIASLFGRAFSVDFTGQNTTITLMYKQEPGVVAEVLSDTQADTLKAKRCNVYAAYDNGTNIIQYGVMSGPVFFDEIHGADWFANALQTAEFNLLYTTPTKIPQTDAGDNQIVTTCNGVCDQAVNNGFAAPGIWNGPSFGSLTTGQYLKAGYYTFIQPLALQSQADREARKAPPVQVALKLAGANQEVDMLVTINR